MTLLLNNSSLLGYVPFQVLIDFDPIVDMHRLMGHRLGFHAQYKAVEEKYGSRLTW